MSDLVPARSPAVISFFNRYGLDTCREFCFQNQLQMLRENDGARIFFSKYGSPGWAEADIELVMEELQEIYEAHTCGHCQENEATLDHIAEHYILLPVRDIKVDDVVGHKGPKS